MAKPTKNPAVEMMERFKEKFGPPTKASTIKKQKAMRAARKAYDRVMVGRRAK
jgi:hypothetical protein